jgi:hypothetical protein
MSIWENKEARGVVQREAKQNLKKNLFVLILQFARCQIIFPVFYYWALCVKVLTLSTETPLLLKFPRDPSCMLVCISGAARCKPAPTTRSETANSAKEASISNNAKQFAFGVFLICYAAEEIHSRCHYPSR